MSLVGPRPIRPVFFEELSHDLPAYWQRLIVRPGLTGLAQVRRGYETSMAEKLAHDLEWIADRSVRLYLRTVVATAWRVLRQSELFGGYYTYAADLLADRVAPFARLARPLVERLPRLEREGEFRLQGEALRPFGASAAARAASRLEGDLLTGPAGRAARLAQQLDPVDIYRARYAETEGADPLARLQDVDFGIYLVDDLLVKTDRASMAHSLEARVPFLDSVVTNFAFALPAKHKVRGLPKKVLLRKAAAPLLPREVVMGASAASRFPPRRGCAASSSRSRARRCRPGRCARRGSSSRSR